MEAGRRGSWDVRNLKPKAIIAEYKFIITSPDV